MQRVLCAFLDDVSLSNVGQPMIPIIVLQVLTVAKFFQTQAAEILLRLASGRL